ncbi:hypothetical protein [Desulfovibrio cuneatus]|uniref:hypothetical protein n=1 Tax=Desulfovibrio cuneatus TaxID=159728 RepID=UPI00047FF307|nr:hypothetical protein [Desulfovibrio cuneatus]
MLVEFLVRLAISILLLVYLAYSGFFKQVSVRRFALMVVAFFIVCFGLETFFINSSLYLLIDDLFEVPEIQFAPLNLVALILAIAFSTVFLHHNRATKWNFLFSFTLFLFISSFVFSITGVFFLIAAYNALGIRL